MRLLNRIAKALYQTPNDLQEIETHRDVRAKLVFFGVMVTACVGLFTFLLGTEALRWRNTAPNYRIAPNDWHVFYAPMMGDCTEGTLAGVTCPANPGNTAIWGSPFLRDPKADDLSSLRKKAAQDFWLGTEISVKVLKLAAHDRANQLVLGWIKGDYSIWANGEMMAEGNRLDREPIVVPLPLGEFGKGIPLKLAIHIHPEMGAGVPDTLAAPLEEGLSDKDHANAFRSLAGFWKKSRPFALFLMNFVFSGLFFMLWFMEKRKQEYFYLAIYGMISALFQARMTDFFFAAFSANINYSIDIMLRFLEGSFGFFLGLAFARGKRSFFRYGIPVAIAVPFIASVSLPDGPTKYLVNGWLDQWMVPVSYLLGAFLCLIQAAYLRSGRRAGALFVPIRERQLILFGAGLIGIAAVYALQSHGLVTFFEKVFVSRFAHFVLVAYLGTIAVLDYREQRRLIEKTPVSRYHKRTTLPSNLTGAILAVDLKNSEGLFLYSATQGQSGSLVETCLSHMWTAAIHAGGIILSTEGDQLKAFFDKDTCADPVAAALLATDIMTEKLQALTEQFREQRILAADGPPLSFRGGISYGHIQPVWQEMDGMRLASWIDAGTTHPILEAVRVMELERKAETPSSSNTVVLNEVLGKEVRLGRPSGLSGKWWFVDQRLVGKHGAVYQVRAYGAGGTAEEIQKAA